MKPTIAILVSIPALLICFAGCNVVGPATVRDGRDSYNDAIHDTTKEQAFLNVVRVADLDTTFFMDVTEVDATVQLQGSANTSLFFPQAFMKAAAGSFSPGHDYGLGGAMQYQESPTIRYQPLTGNALIAQISSPITVDSIAMLFDSDWPLGLLLDLVVDRIAPRARDQYPALNALMDLEMYGAIIPAAIRSNFTFSPGGHSGGAGSGGGGNMALPNDALAIYLEPERIAAHQGQSEKDADAEVARLWARLLRIYAGTQFRTPTEAELKALEETGNYDHIPRCIELRTTPVDPEKLSDSAGASAIVDYAPLLKTHSALGTLRSATLVDLRFQFVTPDQIQDKPWDQRRPADYFYTVSAGADRPLTIRPSNTFIGSSDTHLSMLQMEQGERKLALSRRYMLIVYSDNPAPSNAFVSAQYDAVWRRPGKDPVRKTQYFYIDGADYISIRNFSIVVQLMTMQAIPSQSPQLTPSLTVGGTH